MFVVFLALAIVSLVDLIIGLAWMLTAGADDQAQRPRGRRRDHGRARRRGRGRRERNRGREIGLRRHGRSGDPRGVGVLWRDQTTGAGEQWDAALPILLAMGGLFGLVIFGALALWVKMDDKLIATLIAGVVLFTMARIGWDIYRA